MTSLTIRNVDDATKQRLRVRAARHGVSMEEEVRRILKEVLHPAEAPWKSEFGCEDPRRFDHGHDVSPGSGARSESDAHLAAPEKRDRASEWLAAAE
ncbi:MAG: FitA-like ribbon-helix-helix domain-containing protein, partial [Caldilinea sp.]